jgi:hypothetical protein
MSGEQDYRLWRKNNRAVQADGIYRRLTEFIDSVAGFCNPADPRIVDVPGSPFYGIRLR